MKKLQFVILSVILITGLCSFKLTDKNSFHNFCYSNQDQETKIIDNIYRLQEVQDKEKYLQKLTNSKGHLAIVISNKPTKEIPYYLIQVGYDNSIRFEIYYNFRINFKYIKAKNIVSFIEILDSNSNYVNLIKWRKLKH